MPKMRRPLQPYGWGQALTQAMAVSRYCKTQTALARKSGVAQSSIGRILRGEVNPQTSTMTFLAEALGVPLRSLVGAPEDEVAPAGPPDDKRAEHELEALRSGVREAIGQLERLVRASVE